MADLLVLGTAATVNDQLGARFVASRDPAVSYVVLVNSSDDLVIYKSTNGGAYSQAGGGAVRAGTVDSGWDIWCDWWSPGDTGTLIHIAWNDSGNDDVGYRAFDTNGDSLGTERAVLAGTGVIAGGAVTLTKDMEGGLHVQHTNTAAISTVPGHRFSSDGGVNWSDKADFNEGSVIDYVLMMPGPYADPADIRCYFHDLSADAITMKVYDDSGDSVSEVSIGSSVEQTQSVIYPQMSAVWRWSDDLHFVFFWTQYDNAAADLKCYKIATDDTVTAMTNVITDIDDCFGCAATIDQNTGHIKVYYLGKSDGSETAQATVKVYYKISTDGGSTWGSEVPYSEDTADDFRTLSADLGSTNYRDGAAWYDDDDNDKFFGYVNSVAISPAGVITRRNPFGTAASGNGTTTAPTTPGSLVDGVLLLRVVTVGDTPTITDPGGSWVKLEQIDTGGSGGSFHTRLTVYAAIATGPTLPAGNPSWTGSEDWADYIFTYNGDFDISDVIHDSNTNSGEDTAPIHSQITGMAANNWAFGAVSHDVSFGNVTFAAGLTELSDHVANAARQTNADSNAIDGGTVGAFTHTLSSSGRWATVLVSFRQHVTAALTGTITATVNESDIVAGGKTLIITLTNDTWVAAAGSAFDNQRDEIIAGIDSAQSELLGWDLVPKATQSVTGVVRTSDTVVTITWDAFATYNITAQETITVTVPATALSGGIAIVATPTFTIDTAGGASGNIPEKMNSYRHRRAA